MSPDVRGRGIGRATFDAIETWCRAHGYTELGSDVAFDNTGSLAAQAALGFEPTLRLQFFRKSLSSA